MNEASSREPTSVEIRPVPHWFAGDWYVAYFLGGMLLIPFIRVGLPPLGFLLGGVLLMIPIAIVIRQTGSIRFDEDGILFTHYLVPYRRVAWHDVVSARIVFRTDEDSSATYGRVWLVFESGRSAPIPISFEKELPISESRAMTVFVEQMTRR